MTGDIDERLHAEIQRFAANVTLILQDAVTDAVSDALGSGKRVAKATQATAKTTKPTKAKGAAKKRTRRKKRIRRSPEDLERISNKILSQLNKKPEQGIEEIGAALKMTTKDLSRPMQMLLDGKKVRKKGKLRATRYSKK